MTFPYEQEFELYHYGESICSQKARLGLIEKQIPYKSHHIELCGFSSGCDNLTPEYLGINPDGIVPTLIHKGEPVYEGHYIVKYVEDLKPDQGAHLWPGDEPRRAITEEWFHGGMLKNDNPPDAFGTALPMLSVPILQRLLKMRPTEQLEAELANHPTAYKIDLYLGLHHTKEVPPTPPSAIDALCRGLKRANDNLEEFGGPWLLGDFSLADITMMACFHRLEDAHLDALLEDDRLPNLGVYWRRLQERPSYQEGITDWHDEEYWRKAIQDIYGDAPSPILDQIRERLGELV